MPAKISTLIFLFCTVFSIAAQPIQKKIDSLLQAMEQTIETDRTDQLIEFTRPFMQQDLSVSKNILDQVEQHAVDIGDTSLLIGTNALRAEYFWRKSDYETALKYAIVSIKYANTDPDFKRQKARGYQTAGTIHLYLYNKNEAIDYYRQAVAIYQETGQKKSVASVYNNTGVVYMDAAKESGKPELFDSAQNYFKKTISLRDEANFSTVLNAMSNSASIHVEQGNWQEARDMYDQWKEFAKETGGPLNKAMNYGYIGLMHLELGNFPEAEKYLTEGLKDAQEIESTYEESEYLLYFSRLREKQNNYKDALALYKEHKILQDSLYSVEKVNAVNELEEKYEAAEKEYQLQVANTELNEKERNQIFLAILAFLFVILAVVLWRSYNLKSRSNRILDARNQALSELDTTKNKLFAIISHDLKNPVAAFRNLTGALLENLDHLSREKTESYLEKMNRNAIAVENQLNDLLLWASQQIRKDQLESTEINMEKLSDEVIELVRPMADQKQIELRAKIGTSFKLRSHPEMLKTVIRNLITNAVKFTEKGGLVELVAIMEDDFPEIYVKDTGIGMSDSEVELLFDIRRSEEIGSHPSKGTGIGLSICRDIIEKLDGQISVFSQRDTGTTFKLRFSKLHG